MKHVTATLEHDRHIIRAVIRRFGPISRERVHELTRLRRTSISGIVREWIREGWLVECGRSNNAMGRKQVLLQLNEDHRFVAAVEFDDETVVAGVMDLHPRIVATVIEGTRLDRGKQGLQKQLIACVRKALSRAGVKANALLGIGVADPGLVDSRAGATIASSTIDFWQQIPLRRIFEREFGVPVLVETRTRAKTVAERTLGAGQMLDSMIFVDYGSGIGAGIILDGKLLYGQSCAAGEFGHIQMIQDGPVCKCGSYGCLEAIAGCRAVEARIRRAIAEGGTSRALEMVDGDLSQLTGWTVFRAAREGDKISSHIVVEIGGHLGRGLSNLVNLFNPSAVILDGRLALAGDALLDQVVQIIRRQALAHSSNGLTVRFAQLGNEGSLLGAGLMVLDKFFEIPMLKPPHFLIEPQAAMAGVPR